MCDQQDPASIEGLLRWKRELDLKTHGALPTVILANKADLRVSDKDVWGEEDLAMEELVQERVQLSK